MRILLIFIALVLINGCATQVTSIKQDRDRVLKKDRGYVLLGIETNRDLKSILIDGAENIKLSSADIKEGTNFLLVDLKAGKYTIEKLRLDKYWRVELDDEEYWSFEVEPNQISYVGHLEIVRRGFWGGSTYTELVNRSSEALMFMEDNYPNILANRNMYYGGPGEDGFFQYIASFNQE